jgi:hypothetical protein
MDRPQRTVKADPSEHTFLRWLFVCTLGAMACDTRPKRVAPEGTECTSPYDERSPVRLTCAAGNQCLLMPSTRPGPDGRAYLCLRSCKRDEDCATLGTSYRCEHHDGHGDEHGCTPR